MKNSSTSILWRGLQRGVAAAALVALFPLIIVLYILVRSESKGAFLFRQQRQGLNGQAFEIIKIRTMTAGSEASTRLGTTQTGPHVTRVGKILRALKIDEIPQLWNIVRGDMELVGPRPLPLALSDHLEQHIPGFSVRYTVRPGMSNLGQVSVSDNQIDEQLIADWATRFEGELHYIHHKSLTYDVIIVGLTALYVMRKMIGALSSRRVKQIVECESPGSTRVVCTPISNLDYAGVVKQIGDWVRTGRREYICVVPAHSIVVALWHRAHREVLRGAAICTADGMPVVWIQRLLGYRSATRVYGPTLMTKLLAKAEQEGWRVAFVGGREERLQLLVSNMCKQFPTLKIAEVISPPFRPVTSDEDDAMVDRLRQARPEIVFVGLGCPKQERWMAEHSTRIQTTMIGVGAAFDFHAGELRQAPSVLQRLGLEWAFRLAMEPRRLWKRYATTNPVFLAATGTQVMAHILLRRNYQLPESPSLQEPRIV